MYEQEKKKASEQNLTGIPDSLRKRAEAKSGMSMEDVRVHYNSPKPADYGALAFTMGSEIHIAPGQERHLPHELGHVVQQKQGRVTATKMERGFPVNDNPALEREADKFL